MKIQVQSLFRDSEPHLQRTLSLLESLKEVAEMSFYFYENDSKDDTLTILKNWTDNVFSEKLDAPKFGSVDSVVRTAMMSYYRNKLKYLSGHVEEDYVLLLDSDLIFTAENLEGLVKRIRSLDCAMVTPNTQQNVPDYMFGTGDSSYYDVYCLRDKFGSNCAYFSSCPFYDKEDFMKWTDYEAVRTFSSFAGFCLIRSDVYNKVKWSSDFHSEHVNFCAEVNRYGDIYAIPEAKPRVEIDLSKYSLDNMKKIAENQRNNFEGVNKLRDMSVSKNFLFNKE